VSALQIIEPQRGHRGRWVTSGNPGGLTHEHRDLLKLFRDKCPDAANVLYDIMMDPKAPYSVRAFCAVNWIDRSLGKPRPSVEIERQGQSLEEMLIAIHAAREAKAQERGENDQAG
jgi:hypothetical protein